MVIGACAAHVLDLLAEDFEKIEFFRSLLGKCNALVSFINNHDYNLGIFKTLTTLSLLKPGKTRFGTQFIMCRRVLLVKEAVDLFNNRKLKYWIKPTQKGEGYKEVVNKLSKLVDGDKFWVDLSYIIKAMEPVISFLYTSDGKKAKIVLGFIHYIVYIDSSSPRDTLLKNSDLVTEPKC